MSETCPCKEYKANDVHGDPWCGCGHQYGSHATPGGVCMMSAQVGAGGPVVDRQAIIAVLDLQGVGVVRADNPLSYRETVTDALVAALGSTLPE